MTHRERRSIEYNAWARATLAASLGLWDKAALALLDLTDYLDDIDDESTEAAHARIMQRFFMWRSDHPGTLKQFCDANGYSLPPGVDL